MKIIFLSNFYNHHQSPLCNALHNQAGVVFRFIACEEISDERRKMWGEIRDLPNYVMTPQTDEEWSCVTREVMDADAVVVGSVPQKLLKERIKAGKLVLRYQERPLKDGIEPIKFIPRLLKWHVWNPSNKPIYLLCASAYTAGDYAKMGLFNGKAYKWGYFPETVPSNFSFKEKEPVSILWAGRFLDWKHPDDALQVARRLRDNGIAFNLCIAGAGIYENQICDLIEKFNLGSNVHLLGSLTPQQVRREMERSKIFLFTSDRKEGWGAVLNEAMNSACAVVASDAAGSTPYLIENGVNGLVYNSGKINELYEHVAWLIEHPDDQKRLGICAYKTITEMWNAQVAAQRLCEIIRAILSGDKSPELYENGPCSRA